MFTWKIKLNFSVPLKVDNDEIAMRDPQSSWVFTWIVNFRGMNTSIIRVRKPSKGILMQCRKADGPTRAPGVLASRP